MNRPKLVAILTGVVSLGLAVGYLVLVQVLDYRSGTDFKPAPTSPVK